MRSRISSGAFGGDWTRQILDLRADPLLVERTTRLEALSWVLVQELNESEPADVPAELFPRQGVLSLAPGGQSLDHSLPATAGDEGAPRLQNVVHS